MYKYVMRRIFLILILFATLPNLSAQQFQLEGIIIKGNSKTKERVILREVNFQIGDIIQLKDLDNLFNQNRLQILGTGLFNNVTLNLTDYSVTEAKANIEITLEENWYFFPVPIFELADRNFSVWLKEQNASLSRTNYGFRLGHYNFTGNRDPLRVKVHFGYTNKYELTYSYPYLAYDNKLGVGGSVFYSENKEIAYKTVGNKTLFQMLDDERKLLSRFRIGPEIKFRPTLNSYHAMRIEYHHNQIDPYVAEVLNPDYFLNNRTDLRFFYLEYDYNYDKRLYSQYPRSGYLIFGNIKKEGLGIFNDFNNLSIELGFENHHSINDKFIFSTRNKGKTNLRRGDVAFANNTGLGWGDDIVTGYDLYVMDGTDYFISMNNVKWKFFDQNVNTVKWLPKQFRKVNLILFLRFNADAAYVNDQIYEETNTLNNRVIYGWGPALDMILFNNFLFSFEYSFNDIGEQGLFLSNTIAF